MSTIVPNPADDDHVPDPRGDRVEVFRGLQGWWWHLVAPNGRLIAASGEAFTRKWSAKRAARRAAPGVPIVVRRAR